MALTIKIQNPANPSTYVDAPANPDGVELPLSHSGRHVLFVDYTKGSETKLDFTFEIENRVAQGWYPLQAVNYDGTAWSFIDFAFSLEASKTLRVPLGVGEADVPYFVGQSDGRVRVKLTPTGEADGLVVLRIVPDTPYINPPQYG